MFNFKKIQERESTRDVLDRLKSQEKKIQGSSADYNESRIGGVSILNIGANKKQETAREASTIPEYNIENILKQIISLERKMREDSSNYLNLFYDLRKLEDRFLKAVDFAKANNIQVKENLLRDIELREQVISRRGKRSV